MASEMQHSRNASHEYLTHLHTADLPSHDILANIEYSGPPHSPHSPHPTSPVPSQSPIPGIQSPVQFPLSPSRSPDPGLSRVSSGDGGGGGGGMGGMGGMDVGLDSISSRPSHSPMSAQQLSTRQHRRRPSHSHRHTSRPSHTPSHTPSHPSPQRDSSRSRPSHTHTPSHDDQLTERPPHAHTRPSHAPRPSSRPSRPSSRPSRPSHTPTPTEYSEGDNKRDKRRDDEHRRAVGKLRRMHSQNSHMSKSMLEEGSEG
ncbi:hypothetical protein B484DRAFT_444488 [Ochromonadaceae sp. CCMP2298]|nr:hypothetical protein B484DRAFT_444488 [Ochromonadaceae sp. CCMP2298]